MLSAALIPVLTAMIVVERALEILWSYLEWFLVSVRKWDGETLKRSDYVHFKSATSLLLGMILGIVIADFAAMRLLLNAGINNIAPTWDLLITGVLIGAGTKPIHDLFGILTQLRNFLASSALMRQEEAGRALAEGILRLAQSEAQGMVDVPGVGPARLSPPGSRGVAYNEDDEVEDDERSQIERYAEMLHKGVRR